MIDGPGNQHRRRFFRDALGSLVGPIAEYIEDRLSPPDRRPFLRPPGALAEEVFLDTCYRCGACVEACPADAIRLRQAPDHAAHGTPGIDADLAACVVCDGLLCTHACPSGALRPLTRASDIDMGLAVVAAERCVRSSQATCTICVDRCPIGPAALRFADTGPPTVGADHCVGCGVCQLHCPTEPKAIVVVPG